MPANAAEIRALQRQRLARLLDEIRRSNKFQQKRLAGIAFDVAVDPIDRLPLTTRADLERDQLENPPYGTNLTYPLERFTRLHQTSGSGGVPLRWLDTPESWDWWKDCWDAVFDAAAIAPCDVVLFPFSFGPFIGFWSAFEAAVRRGCRGLAAGGMTTSARLRHLLDHDATVVCCTPTYALHMADAAQREKIDLAGSSVHSIIVAGEPGGSIPATRARIESTWGARVFDHAGMTEVGAWGFELRDEPGGISINEREFIAEVIDPASLQPLGVDGVGELVLTNLGRVGSPVIRYRTGDQVCLQRSHADGRPRTLARLEGGVLGRLDEMVIIRGNNVFPAVVEDELRSVAGVVEFRIRVERRGAMNDLCIDIEPDPGGDKVALCDRVSRAIQDRLGFRPHVTMLEPGDLPRFEFKARRVVRPDGTHP